MGCCFHGAMLGEPLSSWCLCFPPSRSPRPLLMALPGPGPASLSCPQSTSPSLWLASLEYRTNNKAPHHTQLAGISAHKHFSLGSRSNFHPMRKWLSRTQAAPAWGSQLLPGWGQRWAEIWIRTSCRHTDADSCGIITLLPVAWSLAGESCRQAGWRGCDRTGRARPVFETVSNVPSLDLSFLICRFWKALSSS